MQPSYTRAPHFFTIDILHHNNMIIFPLHLILRLTLLIAPLAVLANTETCLIKVPNYYNIPIDVLSTNRNVIQRLNETTSVIDTHPVLNISNYDLRGSQLTLPFDYVKKNSQKVFVKVNNYGNDTFNANDLLNVKLCWPATSPISFTLSHHFISTNELYPEAPISQLDIYVEIAFEGDFYATRPTKETTVPVLLVISKLPNKWIPIPIELYDYLLYAIDLVILCVSGLPLIQLYIQLI